MKSIQRMGSIRTRRNIRTRLSVAASTGAGKNRWLRLKESEQLRADEKQFPVLIRRRWR